MKQTEGGGDGDGHVEADTAAFRQCIFSFSPGKDSEPQVCVCACVCVRVLVARVDACNTRAPVTRTKALLCAAVDSRQLDANQILIGWTLKRLAHTYSMHTALIP